MAARGRNAADVLVLFDVDDTLTAPRKVRPASSLRINPGGRACSWIFLYWSAGDAGDAGVHETAATGDWLTTETSLTTPSYSSGCCACNCNLRYDYDYDFDFGSSTWLLAWWVDLIWPRLPSSSANQVWNLYNQVSCSSLFVTGNYIVDDELAFNSPRLLQFLLITITSSLKMAWLHTRTES